MNKLLIRELETEITKEEIDNIAKIFVWAYESHAKDNWDIDISIVNDDTEIEDEDDSITTLDFSDYMYYLEEDNDEIKVKAFLNYSNRGEIDIIIETIELASAIISNQVIQKYDHLMNPENDEDYLKHDMLVSVLSTDRTIKTLYGLNRNALDLLNVKHQLSLGSHLAYRDDMDVDDRAFLILEDIVFCGLRNLKLDDIWPDELFIQLEFLDIDPLSKQLILKCNSNNKQDIDKELGKLRVIYNSIIDYVLMLDRNSNDNEYLML